MNTPTVRSRSTSLKVLLVGAAAVVTLLATLAVLYGFNAFPFQSRQALVAERGAQVMPFDVEQTMHHFEPVADGGIETVIAKDPANTEQVRLIQEHLQHEVTRFRQGNFADPAAIHGAEMPGLAQLQAGASRIQFHYRALPNGAQIRYTTQDPQLVAALHKWFAAQVSDHGRHASDTEGSGGPGE